jgi:hypothetical protein
MAVLLPVLSRIFSVPGLDEKRIFAEIPEEPSAERQLCSNFPRYDPAGRLLRENGSCAACVARRIPRAVAHKSIGAVLDNYLYQARMSRVEQNRSSRPEGSHLQPLTEPCLNLSIHTALHSD